jgi:hypothetical protein
VIDGRIPRRWPVEVVNAARQFRQGHLVVQPPFSYVGSRRYRIWDVGPDPHEDDAEDERWVDLDLEERPPYGLVTTQTCDLYEERPDPQQPWLMVAPVYDVAATLDRGKQGHLRRDRIRHLMMLTAVELPTGLWVADLRVEFPIEKGWLVGRIPIEAFDSEDRYRLLAERLSSRRDRPAVPTIVLRTIVDPLRAWFMGDGRAWADEIDSVRLQFSGSPLNPTGCRLLVLTDHEALGGPARNALDGWWTGAAAEASSQGLALVGNRYATMDELSARDYANSLRLDFDRLSPDE